MFMYLVLNYKITEREKGVDGKEKEETERRKKGEKKSVSGDRELRLL